MSNEVPEYLKALVGSGMNPDQAFKLANKDIKESNTGPDISAVATAMKNMQRKEHALRFSDIMGKNGPN